MNRENSKRMTQGTLIALVVSCLAVCVPTVWAQTNTFPSSGNVGIGTTSPSDKLSIESSGSGTTIGAYVKNTGGTASGTFSRFSVGQTNSETTGLLFQFQHNDDGAVILNRKSSTGTLDLNTTGGGIRIDNAGSVGIGTTDPLRINGQNFGLSFQVAGNGLMSLTGTPELIFNDTAQAANSRLIDLHSTGGKLLVRSFSDSGGSVVNIAAFDRTGNVGIGTTSPGHALDVNGTIRSRRSDTNYSFVLSPGGVDKWGLYYDSGGEFKIRESGVADRVTILTGGNVGIGTTNPQAPLHVQGAAKVTGNLTVDGNISAKYQDVAEWVESSEQLSAGTVVVLDSTKSNQVISSSQSYDTRVAGVISAQPGITLGERGDSKVLVAATGRVKVKVDATKSPIQIGDLLVTSDVPGVAMKSEAVNLGGVQIHRPGTLIGKALEPLAKGKGEILVLLSLQ